MILDTHVILWFMQGDPRLGSQAGALIAEAFEQDTARISAITLWELAMLSAKGRVHVGKPTLAWFEDVLDYEGIRLVPISPAIGVTAGHLPASIHGDPADRILIATAQHLAMPLLTADRLIIGYAAQGHVQAIDARG